MSLTKSSGWALALFIAVAAMTAAPALADSSNDAHITYGSSQDIARAQTILERNGFLAPGSYNEGEVDDSTHQAIRAFQAAHTLLPTGALNFETTALLLSHGEAFDTDMDGVADNLDRCPNTPRWAKVDAQGCSESADFSSFYQGDRPMVLDGVTFERGSTRLTPGSREALDRVAESLNNRPNVRVAIYGYGDSRTIDTSTLTLARDRADAVRDYLIAHGVTASRLVAKGYGEPDSIAQNDTPEGRGENRRVEIARID